MGAGGDAILKGIGKGIIIISQRMMGEYGQNKGWMAHL